MKEQQPQEDSFLAAILDTVDALVVVMDTEGAIIRFNRACEKATGYASQEVVGRVVWDFLLVPEETEPVKIVFRELRNGKLPTHVENYWLAKDGTRILVSWSNSVITDSEGNTEYIIGTGIDITSQRAAEEALRASENKYRNLFEKANDLLFLYERNDDGEPGHFIEVNALAAERLGYGKEELATLTIRDIITNAAMIESQTITKKLNTDGEAKYERTFKSKTGETIPVEISAHVFKLDGQTVTLAIARDITERQEAQRVLNDERNFVSAVLDTVDALVVVLDANGQILRCNRACERLSGYGADEICGRMAWAFFQFPDHAARVKSFEAKPAVELTKEGEIQITTRSGDNRLLSYSAAPLLDDRGTVQYIIATGTDITERRAAEQEVRQKNEKLLTALAAKSDFLSMVSHELRSPLVPIMGYSELLLDGSLGEVPANFREPLRILHSRAEALSTLIEDLLQLARLERGSLKLELKSTQIKPFINDILRDYKDVDLGKTVEVSWKGDDFKLRADPVRLRQVLQNFIGNSIKYSTDSVKIVIRTSAGEKEGIIEVSDDGIGIPHEKLPHIFERFYQVEHINTREHSGAGLGLSISKELIELMGGSVSVKSEPGKGSVFILTLPLARA